MGDDDNGLETLRLETGACASHSLQQHPESLSVVIEIFLLQSLYIVVVHVHLKEFIL